MRTGKGGVFPTALAVVLIAGLLSSCGFRRKYENPISKDTTQPDKLLYDKAVKDLEKGHYDVARLTLQTLISTYDTSEYLASAKLAMADSWFREGGAAGLGNAEAEYKDFILFYPTLEGAAEAQFKVCDIHYRQMEKPDRDVDQAMRADEECRNLLTNFPNSKYAPLALQRIRNVQEVLAEAEYRTGSYYFERGSYIAAANRLQGLTDHYPLFSQAPDALWKLGESYSVVGRGRLSQQAAAAYSKIVRDYPLSPLVEDAKKKLTALEQPVPEPDSVQESRMRYELANYDKPGIISHFWGIFRRSPDVSAAAKSGQPATSVLRPSTPISVPGQLPPLATAGSDVTVSTVPDSAALDALPDARQAAPSGAGQSQETTPAPSR
jgi:outer membrane protein assembly factor BamD